MKRDQQEKKVIVFTAKIMMNVCLYMMTLL